MNTKDWILLITPIIANGVIVFIAQQLLRRRFNRLESIDKRKKEITEKFLNMLFDCIEVVSETEKQFRFREDMEVINEKFRISISELSRYGRNMDFVLNISDDVEKLRAKCGFCHNSLIRYNALGNEKARLFPLEEQEQIMNHFSEIKLLFNKISKKCIKL